MRRSNIRSWRSLSAAGLVAAGVSGCTSLDTEVLSPSAGFSCVESLGSGHCLSGTVRKPPVVTLESGWKMVDEGDEKRPAAYGYGVTLRFDFLNP